MTDQELRNQFAALRKRIDEIPTTHGHFWILVLLLAIAAKTGACK